MPVPAEFAIVQRMRFAAGLRVSAEEWMGSRSV